MKSIEKISTTLPKVKILLVDDRPENLFALENVLKELDLIIFKADSGREALGLLLEHDFGLAIVDVQMPEIDGFELAELMRGTDKTKKIPIIFVTAGAINAHFTFKGYEAGAVDFLYKPLDAQVVRNKVRVFRELEEQRLLIEAQMKELERAIRAREEFLSIASHELKTPLTSVKLQLQLANHCFDGDPSFQLPMEKLHDLVRSSSVQLGKLNNLVDDLLDVSRIQAGKLTMNIQPVNLSDLVFEVVERYRQPFLMAASHLNLEIAQNTWVDCDPFRTEQVLVNLFSNAIKYAPGTETLIYVRPTDTHVRFGICDKGNGISTDQLDLIFEKFGQVRSGSGSRGLGLGLYIVRQIVESENGQINVTTEQGKGSDFCVELPRRSPPAARAEV